MAESNPARLILVGGFLGAGKTTLLARAAERLAAAGKRVGLVTNDQAVNLVDTRILQSTGLQVREVAGGCFCCRFPDLVTALGQLADQANPDVLICEPVGSCTDLSATVIRPLEKLHGERFRVAPYSVLVDPSRAEQSLSQRPLGGFSENVLYIYRKQLEEADLILLNKADLWEEAQREGLKDRLSAEFPGRPVLPISALRGDGVDAWLERVNAQGPSVRPVAEVDYDRYAEGEAALGWLNADVAVRSSSAGDWRAFCLDLLETIRRELRSRSAEIAHLKLRLTGAREPIQANLTSTSGQAVVEGSGTAEDNSAGLSLLINARVHIDPESLRAIVERSLVAALGAGMEASIRSLESFKPGRPVPTYRMQSVV